MGHGTLGKLLSPKQAASMAIDPAGTAVRTARGVPTTPRTIADPGNAIWPQAAPGVPYATSNPGNAGPQIPAGAPMIDPKTNMRVGSGSQTPMATSIGGLTGKNQIPMPAPQVGQQPQQPQLPDFRNNWGVGTPSGPRAM